MFMDSIGLEWMELILKAILAVNADYASLQNSMVYLFRMKLETHIALDSFFLYN